MNEIRPLSGGTSSSIVNGKNAALNQFDTMEKLGELPDLAETTEVKLRSIELFQILTRFITENATTGKDISSPDS